MIAYLLDRGFDLRVFTSGLLSDRLLSDAETVLQGVPLERCSFVCNLNDPVQTRHGWAIGARARFLRTFGSRTAAGFNIYRPDFDLRFLFELILEYGLARTIRFGLAILFWRRQCVPALDAIDRTIDQLFTFRPWFERLRIKPGFDCGFRSADSRMSASGGSAGRPPTSSTLDATGRGHRPRHTVWSCFRYRRTIGDPCSSSVRCRNCSSTMSAARRDSPGGRRHL